MALKCADICNPCRPWELSKQWSEKVTEEFFQQGLFLCFNIIRLINAATAATFVCAES